jgi:hypothetical protein
MTTKVSFGQNTTISSILESLLHVPVTSNHHQADVSVHRYDMFSATLWGPMLYITEYSRVSFYDGITFPNIWF